MYFAFSIKILMTLELLTLLALTNLFQENASLEAREKFFEFTLENCSEF